MKATKDPGQRRLSHVSKSSGSSEARPYDILRTMGTGSFGTVYEAKDKKRNCQVAIKKVLQDSRYKNRELQIMRQLEHPNIVRLMDFFYTDDPSSPRKDQYLNLVMEFVPETVHRVLRQCTRANNLEHGLSIPMIRIYIWQLCRAVAYMHASGLSHRDIKPQNLLVDQAKKMLKLCDFGSAKKLVPPEQSVAYICSRYYRAPELILGAQEYSCQIDTWSIGCVLGELVLGRPLFAGESSMDQWAKIVQLMGSPSKREMAAMNPQSKEEKTPQGRSSTLEKHFRDCGVANRELLSLLDALLKYDPTERLRPIDALAHPFFDELMEYAYLTEYQLDASEEHLFGFTELEVEDMQDATRLKLNQQVADARRRQAATVRASDEEEQIEEEA